MKKLLFSICMLSPALLFAQGFQVNLQGQKQQAMGGAGVATNLDAASVFYNPGSVSHLESNSVSAGVSFTSGSTAFRDANSQEEYHTVSPISTPFTGYGVWDQRKVNSNLQWGFTHHLAVQLHTRMDGQADMPLQK